MAGADDPKAAGIGPTPVGPKHVPKPPKAEPKAEPEGPKRRKRKWNAASRYEFSVFFIEVTQRS